jgi:hypothetical protein
MDSSGQIATITPQMSTWYFLYVGNELLNDDITLQRQFRNRFRMTYQSFLDLIEMCKASDIFSAWCQRKAKNNKQSSIVELLLLGDTTVQSWFLLTIHLAQQDQASFSDHFSSSQPMKLSLLAMLQFRLLLLLLGLN